MKKSTLFAVLTALLLTICTGFSQDNIGSSVSLNKPHSTEIGRETYHESDAFYSQELEVSLKNALESGNKVEANRIQSEINSKIPAGNKFPAQFNVTDDEFVAGVQAPYTPDWYNTDVTVHSGDLKSGSPYFRQIDMKQGEDGQMYIAMNRAPISGTNGRIDVYRSSNAGVTWVSVGGVQTTTAYYGTVSMLVELRDAGNLDSTRITVFYTRSATSNNDDATLNYASMRRDGSAFYTAQIAAPPAGFEFSFATSASDGAFYSSNTYLGVFCTISNNALSATSDFKFFRSADWGATWTGVTISTSFDDFYPSAEYRPAASFAGDSIFIAVERRLSATQYEIRVIRTPWTPTASSNTYFVTSGGANVKYEKPALAIKQNRASDTAMFTATKNGVSLYFPTVNGGYTWSVDFNLGGAANGNNKSFTWCNTSSRGPNNIIAMWVSNDGDSINVRRGQVGNLSLGSEFYKRNSNTASTTVAPTCMIYNPNASTNLSAFSYAGLGPLNLYANQEGLVTGIQHNGNTVPNAYMLEQNYPNPFNPTTNINFSVPKSGLVKLVVYDIMGREVASLVNKDLTAGSYTVDMNASSLSTGVYFYSITAGDFKDTKKMMLVK